MNTEKKYNIAFFGTPDLCIPILEELKNSGFIPSLIITNEAKPVGRKHTLTNTPVAVWGLEHSIKILTPKKLTPELIEAEISPKNDQAKWDLFIVVAYGKILPEALINIPEFGTINIHYSLLPRWRGASPVSACGSRRGRARRAGESWSGRALSW